MINIFEVVQFVAGAIAVIAGTYKYTASRFIPKIEDAVETLEKVGKDKTVALEAINEISTLIAHAKAAKADGEITAEEMEKIFDELMSVVSSPAVKELLEDFSK